MRVTVIGGSGHIGTYLTPRLVEAGHTVTCVSRSQREPYTPNVAWREVECRTIDRASDDFGRVVLACKPDVVIDLICYTLESARDLVEALKDRVQQFLHCGTIWVHGPGVELPLTEDQPRRPISDYGRRKAAIEEYLLNEPGVPAAVLHPGVLRKYSIRSNLQNPRRRVKSRFAYDLPSLLSGAGVLDRRESVPSEAACSVP
jgi:nucleoside-diphosphate-sugar epimerase